MVTPTGKAMEKHFFSNMTETLSCILVPAMAKSQTAQITFKVTITSAAHSCSDRLILFDLASILHTLELKILLMWKGCSQVII